MKAERGLPAVSITKRAEQSVKNGHPWIYAGELETRSGAPEDGGLVDVFAGNAWMGTGLYNSASKIVVRIISRNANDTFDDTFWYRRAKYAVDYRRTVMPGDDFKCCRLCHGEADQLPGLTVDRYNDLLSVEILSLGIERRRDTVLSGFLRALSEIGEEIRGVYLRNEAPLRAKEGMAPEKGWYLEPPGGSAVTEIVENGIRYLVDVENGQKTGFFLDQKHNRAAAARLAPGKRVLDCFTHTGSFGLNCAAAGALSVTSVDISDTAIEMARENARRNGLTNIEFVTANVFDLLAGLCERKCRDYDYVILDPPAFTKSRDTVAGAERGYKEINYRAMRLLPRGGYLATCSCSHFMTDERFRAMLRSAARDAGVSLRQIEARQQAPDHPVLWNVPETEYLKFYLFQVV